MKKADKFAVGQKGNKGSKFVEAAKGTNLFFAIYETEQEDPKTGEVTRKRSYATIPLNVVINRLKRGLSPALEDENGNSPKYVLSPNDLVYLPTQEELKSGHICYPLDKNRIYRMISCTGSQLYFLPYFVANMIINKYEYGLLNKVEFSIDKQSIKKTCIPINVDRLGNLIK